ncbi:hypothetical protein ZWY2020_011135 [Hordeum vulgare]|nr:hypothetical protein ZWY2020_011135 [Hordeum vulgare]
MLQFLPRLIIFELDYMAVLYCLCCSKESTSLCRMRKNLCMCSRRRTLKFQAGAPAHVWLTVLFVSKRQSVNVVKLTSTSEILRTIGSKV